MNFANFLTLLICAIFDNMTWTNCFIIKIKENVQKEYTEIFTEGCFIWALVFHKKFESLIIQKMCNVSYFLHKIQPKKKNSSNACKLLALFLEVTGIKENIQCTLQRMYLIYISSIIFILLLIIFLILWKIDLVVQEKLYRKWTRLSQMDFILQKTLLKLASCQQL